jgi:hypothetical protein
MRISGSTRKKPRECDRCGCARKRLVTPKIRTQDSNGTSLQVALKEICVICLLDIMGLTTDTMPPEKDRKEGLRYLRQKKAMEVVEDADTV